MNDGIIKTIKEEKWIIEKNIQMDRWLNEWINEKT